MYVLYCNKSCHILQAFVSGTALVCHFERYYRACVESTFLNEVLPVNAHLASMLTSYTRDQLIAFDQHRPPSRSLRKVIFSYQLWCPRRLRRRPDEKSCGSKGCDHDVIVNKQHVRGSSVRLGWLNARSISN